MAYGGGEPYGADMDLCLMDSALSVGEIQAMINKNGRAVKMQHPVLTENIR